MAVSVSFLQPLQFGQRPEETLVGRRRITQYAVHNRPVEHEIMAQITGLELQASLFLPQRMHHALQQELFLDRTRRKLLLQRGTESSQRRVLFLIPSFEQKCGAQPVFDGIAPTSFLARFGLRSDRLPPVLSASFRSAGKLLHARVGFQRRWLLRLTAVDLKL